MFRGEIRSLFAAAGTFTATVGSFRGTAATLRGAPDRFGEADRFSLEALTAAICSMLCVVEPGDRVAGRNCPVQIRPSL